MGWTISHGTPRPGHPFDGFHSRTYTQVAEWLDAVRASLPAADLAILKPLLTELGTGPADPFDIRPATAAALYPILRNASSRVPRRHRELTEAVANAAQRAAAAGQNWHWS
jgi:hypothetical protein